MFFLSRMSRTFDIQGPSGRFVKITTTPTMLVVDVVQAASKALNVNSDFFAIKCVGILLSVHVFHSCLGVTASCLILLKPSDWPVSRLVLDWSS